MSFKSTQIKENKKGKWCVKLSNGNISSRHNTREEALKELEDLLDLKDSYFNKSYVQFVPSKYL